MNAFTKCSPACHLKDQHCQVVSVFTQRLAEQCFPVKSVLLENLKNNKIETTVFGGAKKLSKSENRVTTNKQYKQTSTQGHILYRQTINYTHTPTDNLDFLIYLPHMFLGRKLEARRREHAPNRKVP